MGGTDFIRCRIGEIPGMNKRRLVVAFVAINIWSTPALSLTYKWPVIESVKITPVSSSTAEVETRYYMQQVTDSTTASTSVCTVFRSNGLDCYDGSPFYGKFAGRRVYNGQAIMTDGTLYSFTYSGSDWAGLVRAAEQKWGSSSSTTFVTDVPITERVCAGFYASLVPPRDFNLLSWDGMIGRHYDPTANGRMCVYAPPINQWCALTNPSVELAYGTLSLQNAGGNEQSTNVEVQCTAGMKYSLSLRSMDNMIPLSNGMNAEIRASGLALGSALSGNQGINPVQIKSKLSGKPTRSGPFEGSGVLYVMYP